MSESRKTVTEVSIPSNANYLKRLRKIVGCVADCAGMNTKEAHDAKLAITEACANAIRHGSSEGSEDKVSIRISAASGTVVTEVTDQGDGFDPAKLVTRPISEPGGLGIPLMRALSDDLQFERNLQGMTVRLVKTAKTPSENRRKR